MILAPCKERASARLIPGPDPKALALPQIEYARGDFTNSKKDSGAGPSHFYLP